MVTLLDLDEDNINIAGVFNSVFRFNGNVDVGPGSNVRHLVTAGYKSVPFDNGPMLLAMMMKL